jgi:hypothetical protein
MPKYKYFCGIFSTKNPIPKNRVNRILSQNFYLQGLRFKRVEF